MDFSVNYYNNEYNKQYLFDEEIYLKYPGFSASLDEMVTMPKIKTKYYFMALYHHQVRYLMNIYVTIWMSG